MEVTQIRHATNRTNHSSFLADSTVDPKSRFLKSYTSSGLSNVDNLLLDDDDVVACKKARWMQMVVGTAKLFETRIIVFKAFCVSLSLSYLGCHANKENVTKMCKASSQFLSVACLPLTCLGHQFVRGLILVLPPFPVGISITSQERTKMNGNM